MLKRGPTREEWDGAPLLMRAGYLGRQRESCGSAGGGGRGTDDDCAADECALGCGGLGCGMEAACWAGAGGVNDIFCLMSSSTACSAAMFWAICSCLYASCSTLRRTTSRLDARGSSCCTAPGEVAATTGDFAVEMDSNQASVGARATATSFAALP